MTVYGSAEPLAGDPVVPTETLLRFSEPGPKWDSEGRPTAAVLSFKRDEDGLSLYLQDLLGTRQLTPRAVLENRQGYGLLAVSAEVAISAGCAVRHDPVLLSEPKPIDFAHALILRMDDKPRWKLARAALLDAAFVLIPPTAA